MILQSVRYPAINTRFAAAVSSSADVGAAPGELLPLRRTAPHGRVQRPAALVFIESLREP